MNTPFESTRQAVLESMLIDCLGHADHIADEVYLHCVVECGVSSADVFYDINGKLYRMRELDGPEDGDRTLALLIRLMDSLDALVGLHQHHAHPPPTGLKLHYDAVRDLLSVAWSYDLQFSDSGTLLPADLFDAWFEEVSMRPRRIA
ncbi:hypothetical protein [Stenotrophomonas sp.]|uniref:hypothetical protein n=1 Tax=Stenotrophomonas sp. TaxID=69392 RepID=UPI002D45188A|nr:hypothetical protein [Stenotrophomonas sp.]HYQ23332.1 hypothetical protein [Stenotrophomonas sp.]